MGSIQGRQNAAVRKEEHKERKILINVHGTCMTSLRVIWVKRRGKKEYKDQEKVEAAVSCYRSFDLKASKENEKS